MSRLLVLRGLEDHHRVGEQVTALLGHDELDVRVLGDAVIAPSVPGLDHGSLAGDQPRVERGVVVGEQVRLRCDEGVLYLLHLGLVGRVHRVPERLLGGEHEPPLGAEHGHLALEVGRRLKKIIPACRHEAIREVASVADAGRAPCVRHGELVADVVGKLSRLRVEVLEVGDEGRIDVGEEALLGECLRVLAGDERHVDAGVAAARDLGNDLLVRRMLRHRDRGAGLLLELRRQVLGHVGIPVRDDEGLLAQVGIRIELLAARARAAPAGCERERGTHRDHPYSPRHAHSATACSHVLTPIRRREHRRLKPGPMPGAVCERCIPSQTSARDSSFKTIVLCNLVEFGFRRKTAG